MARGAMVICLIFASFIGSCNDPYGASEKAAADIGTGIGVAFQTVDQLRVSGAISIQEERNVLGYLKFANDSNGAFAVCAASVHKSGGKYSTCGQTFLTALNTPQELALIHVANTQANQTIETAVAGVVGGIATLLAALGGK